MGRGLAIALSLLSAGCWRTPAPVRSGPGDASAASVDRPAPGPARPPPVALCEAELSGHLRLPPQSRAPAPMVFVAIGDCLADPPRIVGHGGTTAGRFFVEVFVPCGVELTLCAASEPTPGAASPLYARAAGTLHVEQGQENEWKGIEVLLAHAPARRFPHDNVPPAATR